MDKPIIVHITYELTHKTLQEFIKYEAVTLTNPHIKYHQDYMD